MHVEYIHFVHVCFVLAVCCLQPANMHLCNMKASSTNLNIHSDQADLPPPIPLYLFLEKNERWWRRWICENPHWLLDLSGLHWVRLGGAKNRQFLRQKRIKEKKMKEGVKKKDFPHSTSAAFPWQPFSQHRHLQGRLWCRVCIFDKVVATQKKGHEGIKKEEMRGKERGLQRKIRRWVTWGK